MAHPLQLHAKGGLPLPLRLLVLPQRHHKNTSSRPKRSGVERPLYFAVAVVVAVACSPQPNKNDRVPHLSQQHRDGWECIPLAPPDFAVARSSPHPTEAVISTGAQRSGETPVLAFAFALAFAVARSPQPTQTARVPHPVPVLYRVAILCRVAHPLQLHRKGWVAVAFAVARSPQRHHKNTSSRPERSGVERPLYLAFAPCFCFCSCLFSSTSPPPRVPILSPPHPATVGERTPSPRRRCRCLFSSTQPKPPGVPHPSQHFATGGMYKLNPAPLPLLLR